MNSLTVEPVTTRKDVARFIRFAWRIYEGNPQWVPPLLMDRRKLMDKEKNPFYRHAEAVFFAARRNGEYAGRIGAIVNHNHNKEHNEKIGFFGFFECVDDQEVADALFGAAREWVKKQGMTSLRGPASPSVNDEYGLLVGGFEHPPVVLMPYNPPYYATLIERGGFRKIKDLYAYLLVKEKAFSEKLRRVTELVRQKEELTFRCINMSDFKNEIRTIRELYNRAWQYNWGAVPMTDEEFDALAKDLKPVVVPELVIIAEHRGEPVGFSLSLPDLNMALKHNRSGRLLPGLYSLMRYKKRIDTVRIIVLGVVREKQRTGAASLLFYETGKRSVDMGYPRGEAGWVLEDNVMMNRAAEMMGAERYKTYRIYEQTL